jgi:phage terminase large subunit GpA-like protein
MFFPSDYEERYFKMLTAEEKLENGTFICPEHTRNEALDCRCINLCAGDVFLENMVLDMKAEIKAKRGTREHIDLVDTRYIIEMLKKERGIK